MARGSSPVRTKRMGTPRNAISVDRAKTDDRFNTVISTVSWKNNFGLSLDFTR